MLGQIELSQLGREGTCRIAPSTRHRGIIFAVGGLILPKCIVQPELTGVGDPNLECDAKPPLPMSG